VDYAYSLWAFEVEWLETTQRQITEGNIESTIATWVEYSVCTVLVVPSISYIAPKTWRREVSPWLRRGYYLAMGSPNLSHTGLLSLSPLGPCLLRIINHHDCHDQHLPNTVMDTPSA
jgi:hypothetical protein